MNNSTLSLPLYSIVALSCCGFLTKEQRFFFVFRILVNVFLRLKLFASLNFNGKDFYYKKTALIFEIQHLKLHFKAFYAILWVQTLFHETKRYRSNCIKKKSIIFN